MKKKTKIAQRMWNVHIIDSELERGFCVLKEYVKYGDYWYNCTKSPEKFWYIK